MISRDEILMGRDKQYPLTPQLEQNLQLLLVAVNKFRTYRGIPMIVTSGYRPAAINANVPNAAKNSNHMVCLAADFKDIDRQLTNWCLSNLDKLAEFGLWMEDPGSTPTWCHLQAVSPRSGNRVFKP